MSPRQNFIMAGRRAGAAGQFLTEQALYAQRRQPELTASMSPPQQPAAGYGAPSALQGPAHAQMRGQPIFRRYSP